MAFQGPLPIGVPLTPAQIRLAGDQLYGRLDKANAQQHVFPNAFINASFDHWQRGNGPFSVSGAGTAYGPDRWRVGNIGANGSASITRKVLAFGDAVSQSRLSPVFACTGHSAAGDGALFCQIVEDCATYAGRRAVVRGLLCGTVGQKIAIEIERGYGAGGSANDYLYVGTVVLTAALTAFQFFVDIPSLSNKVLGSDVGFVNVNYFYSAGSNFNARTNNLGLQTGNVQPLDLEFKEVKPGYGDAVPGFERAPKDLDLLRCLRFFEKSYNIDVAPGSVADFSQAKGSVTLNAGDCYDIGFTPMQVAKRVGPTITVYSPLSGASGSSASSNNSQSYAGCVANIIGNKSFCVRNSANAWLTNNAIFWAWTASAEY